MPCQHIFSIRKFNSLDLLWRRIEEADLGVIPYCEDGLGDWVSLRGPFAHREICKLLECVVVHFFELFVEIGEMEKSPCEAFVQICQ